MLRTLPARRSTRPFTSRLNNTAPRLVFAGIVIASTLYVYLTSAQLPDPVASQFGNGGEVTNHMSRDDYQAFTTGITLLIPLLLLVLQVWLPRVATRFVSIPRRVYWLAPERRAQMLDYLERHALIFGSAPALFFAAMHWMILDANSRVPPQMNNSLLLAMAGLFVAWVIAAAVTLSLHFRRAA